VTRKGGAGTIAYNFGLRRKPWDESRRPVWSGGRGKSMTDGPPSQQTYREKGLRWRQRRKVNIEGPVPS